MKNLVVCVIILLALALNSEATAPVQLSGSNGQSILSQIAITVQTNNTSVNSGQANNISTNTNLWNWGSIPIGYTVNNSGILTSLQYANNGDWTPSI